MSGLQMFFDRLKAGGNPGLTYLRQNAKAAYIFETLVGASGAAITSVPDIGPNGYTLSNAAPAQAPKIVKAADQLNQYSVLGASPTAGSKDVLISTQNGNAFFRSSFEVIAVMDFAYSGTAYEIDVCGSGDGTDLFKISYITNQWNIQYRYSGGGGKFFFALSPTTFFNGFPRGKTLIEFKMDFENDVCTFHVNGENIALTFNGANTIDTVNPTLFNQPTSKFCVGGYNLGGTITSRTTAHNQYALAITPIRTPQQRVDVNSFLLHQSAVSKRIVSFGDTQVLPIRKTTDHTTLKVGYALGSAPSGNVTVNITTTGKATRLPTSLTFTTSNWGTPQEVTFTAVADGVQDIITDETITLTCSGGGYDGVTLQQPLFVYDTPTGTYYLAFFGAPEWFTPFYKTAGLEATRNALINFVFNGNGLPVGYSDLTVMSTSHTGVMHGINSSALTGFSSITRYRVTKLDVDGFTWTHYAYRIYSSTPNNKLIVQSEGHGEPGSAELGTASLINQLLAAGYDVLYRSMPVRGENVETNPTITATGSTGHNQFLSGGLDRVGYSPLELFFFDIHIALNYIADNDPYDEIYAVGISGGAWTVSFLSAMDTRITKTMAVRGPTMPPVLNTGAGDYEQGNVLATSGTRLFNGLYRTICSYMDIIVLASSNRMYKTIANTYDTSVGHVVHKYTNARYVKECAAVGGVYKIGIDNQAANAYHQYQTSDIAEIMEEL